MPIISLHAGTCEGLKHSPAFLVASELLQTTAKSINEETITVEEVRVITNDPYIQQNLEQMLGLLPNHKEVTERTLKKLQIAKSELVTFEKERSQLVSLTTRWHRYIGPKDEGKFDFLLNARTINCVFITNTLLCYGVALCF